MLNWNVWGTTSPPIDYNKIDIDRMNALEEYTDYKFSTSDKIKGTISGLKKEANKDINNLSNFTSSIQKGAKTMILLLIILVIINSIDKVKKWI